MLTSIWAPSLSFDLEPRLFFCFFFLGSEADEIQRFWVLRLWTTRFTVSREKGMHFSLKPKVNRWNSVAQLIQRYSIPPSSYWVHASQVEKFSHPEKNQPAPFVYAARCFVEDMAAYLAEAFLEAEKRWMPKSHSEAIFMAVPPVPETLGFFGEFLKIMVTSTEGVSEDAGSHLTPCKNWILILPLYLSSSLSSPAFWDNAMVAMYLRSVSPVLTPCVSGGCMFGSCQALAGVTDW